MRSHKLIESLDYEIAGMSHYLKESNSTSVYIKALKLSKMSRLSECIKLDLYENKVGYTDWVIDHFIPKMVKFRHYDDAHIELKRDIKDMRKDIKKMREDIRKFRREIRAALIYMPGGIEAKKAESHFGDLAGVNDAL